MRAADSALAVRHAVALGLLQGPAELLPISSSGHTTLAPWFAGSSHAGLDGELRKSLDVALHAGAGVALAIDMHEELLAQLRGMDRTRASVIVLSLAPAALAGFALRAPIEHYLSGPRSIAAGLAMGALAMAVADARAPAEGRADEEALALDGLALGLAQAAALIPGVSRNGATLTAARARGFSRAGAQSLSWELALPVILAATTLKAGRLMRHGVLPRTRVPLAAGAASSFVSTLLSARILSREGRANHSLLPYAVYRWLLAGAVAIRLRRMG
ncbi:MAG TPA: undecaprenyl-diphosphate phosphatase [Solirubrobacteraceae bacterium]|jgi:undecaprenyl-diphosphatase|nr:undecaprenyl-diphosphate phosphatase [Solirubrobacteraceae bacterium]